MHSYWTQAIFFRRLSNISSQPIPESSSALPVENRSSKLCLSQLFDDLIESQTIQSSNHQNNEPRASDATAIHHNNQCGVNIPSTTNTNAQQRHQFIQLHNHVITLLHNKKHTIDNVFMQYTRDECDLICRGNGISCSKLQKHDIIPECIKLYTNYHNMTVYNELNNRITVKQQINKHVIDKAPDNNVSVVPHDNTLNNDIDLLQSDGLHELLNNDDTYVNDTIIQQSIQLQHRSNNDTANCTNTDYETGSKLVLCIGEYIDYIKLHQPQVHTLVTLDELYQFIHYAQPYGIIECTVQSCTMIENTNYCRIVCTHNITMNAAQLNKPKYTDESSSDSMISDSSDEWVPTDHILKRPNRAKRVTRPKYNITNTMQQKQAAINTIQLVVEINESNHTAVNNSYICDTELYHQRVSACYTVGQWIKYTSNQRIGRIYNISQQNTILFTHSLYNCLSIVWYVHNSNTNSYELDCNQLPYCISSYHCDMIESCIDAVQSINWSNMMNDTNNEIVLINKILNDIYSHVISHIPTEILSNNMITNHMVLYIFVDQFIQLKYMLHHHTINYYNEFRLKFNDMLYYIICNNMSNDSLCITVHNMCYRILNCVQLQYNHELDMNMVNNNNVIQSIQSDKIFELIYCTKNQYNTTYQLLGRN